MAAQRSLIANFYRLPEIVAYYDGIKAPDAGADTTMWHKYNEKVERHFKASPWESLGLLHTGYRLRADSPYLLIIRKSLQTAICREPTPIDKEDLVLPHGAIKTLETFAKKFDILTDEEPSWLLTATKE
jgi:hypothetical protein